MKLKHPPIMALHATSRGFGFVVMSGPGCYASAGALTWQDIAEAVARQLEPLRQMVPTRRKAWQSEARRMSIFTAAAVAMVYWQLADPTQTEAGAEWSF